jgi:hypothetical protein
VTSIVDSGPGRKIVREAAISETGLRYRVLRFLRCRRSQLTW